MEKLQIWQTRSFIGARLSGFCLKRSKLVILFLVCAILAEMTASAQTTIFSEGFEGIFTPIPWFIGNNNSNTTAKWGANTAKAYSGSQSCFCANNGLLSLSRKTYDNNLNTYLQRREISLAEYASVTLTFKYWMNSESTWDTFQVNVRNSSGTWTNHMEISGNSSGWQTRTINLNEYAGQTGIYIGFDFVSDASVIPSGDAGVWIDDVVLSGTPKIDLALRDLQVTHSPASSRTFESCSFEIYNDGPGLASGNMTVEYYLSSDTNFGNLDDKLIGYNGFNYSLASGEGVCCSLDAVRLSNMTLLWTEGLIPNGNYYVFAKITSNAGIEKDPSDNDTRTSSYISYTGEPSIQPDQYEFDPDESPSACFSISNGQRQERTIHRNADQDWAHFTIGQYGAENIRIWTNGDEGDTELWLFGPDNSSSQIAYDDDNGTGSFSEISLSFLQTGKYYIKVTGYDQDEIIPDYSLRIAWTDINILEEGLVSVSDIVPSTWDIIGPENISGRFDATLKSAENPNAIQILVVGVRDDAGSWVTGIEPVAVLTTIPENDQDGEFFNDLAFNFSTKTVSATQTWHVWVCNAYAVSTSIAVNAFKERIVTAEDYFNRKLGTLVVHPQEEEEGIVSVSDIVPSTWDIIGPENISGRFDATLKSCAENPNAIQILVVGLRDDAGSWVTGIEPVAVLTTIPENDQDGEFFNDLSFNFSTKTVSTTQTWHVWVCNAYVVSTSIAVNAFKERIVTAEDHMNRKLGTVVVNPPNFVFSDRTLHHYELVHVPEGITWTDAKNAAAAKSKNGVPGHLATITSVEENSFIVDALKDDLSTGIWIGGDQLPRQAPNEGWGWITGETWSYTNWRSDVLPEPNDSYGDHEEDALEIMFTPNESYSFGKWNDLPKSSTLFYYLVEYPSMYCRRTAGGMINGQPVDELNETVRVNPGALLLGTFNVTVNNTMHGGAVAPLAATVNWGDRTTQFWTVDNWISTGVNIYSVPVNCIVPNEPGDYYLVVGFSGMYSGSQVMSSTTAGRNAVWNDGNDVGFDWTDGQFGSALNNKGIVWVNMLQMDNHQYTDAQPFTAVRIRVSNPSAEIVSAGWRYPRYDRAGLACSEEKTTEPVGAQTFMDLFQISDIYREILTGDVDGDGAKEIIATTSSELRIYDCSGQLKRTVTLPKSCHVTMLEDLNGDGILDIGLGCNDQAFIFDGFGILLRTFNGPRTDDDIAMWPIGFSGTTVLMGYQASYSGSPRGMGAFDYASSEAKWYYQIGPGCEYFSVADMDADGKLDITNKGVTVHNGASGNNTTDGDLYLIVVDEDGVAKISQKYPAPSDGGAGHVFADMDGDGIFEIVGFEDHGSPYFGTSQIHIYDPSGATLFSFDGPENVCWQYAIGDIISESEGLEIVASTGSHGIIYILNNQLEIICQAENLGMVKGLADLNGDGILEIVTFSDSGELRILNFQLTVKTSTTVGNTNANVVISDIDSDGIVDILCSSDKLYVLTFDPSAQLFCRRASDGVLNDQIIDTDNNTVTITQGSILQGTVYVETINPMHENAVAPLAATVTWGEPTTQFWNVNNWIDTGTNIYPVQVNCIVPEEPGDYYLIIGFLGVYEGEQVMSSTHAEVDAVWHDGNDVGFDWTNKQFEDALSNSGVVWVKTLMPDGSYNLENQPYTAVRIRVIQQVPLLHSVIFDLGEHGTRTGGGNLQQEVEDGHSAIEPVFSVADEWEFIGWDNDFSIICEPTNITALFRHIENNPSPWGKPVIYPNVAMTILAEVLLSGGETVPDGSAVAVFVGEELRGKQIITNQQGRVFANLTVNVDNNGETLSFKLWNSSTQEISDCAATILAQSGQSIGTPDDPVELHFGLVQQTLSLQSGWNHISFYTGFSDDSPDTVFAPVMDQLDKIISDGKNYTPGWGALNTLQHLRTGLGHWVNLSSPAELTVSGHPLEAADTPIALQAGWNNVAFIFDSPASIEGALAGILPQVEKVIGEGKNFTPGWGALNSLTQLNPGKGYWIKTSAATTLIYQDAGLTRGTRSDNHSEIRSQESWIPVQYPSTPYTLLASVRLDTQPVAAGDLVGVFVGEECRAVGEMIPSSGITYTNLTVSVNTNGENATFKFYDASTGAILDGTVEVTLSSGSGQGTPQSPFLLEFTSQAIQHAVTFDPGEHGTRIGGGELQQQIVHGEAALAPEIEVAEGWNFVGWDQAFDCIVAPITVYALYQALPANDFEFAVQVSWDSGITYTLQMAAGPDASDEYVFGEDCMSDLPLPPLPSPAAEEAFFKLPESTVKLLWDAHFLDDTVDVLSWTLVVAVPHGNPVTLSWDSLAVPAGWRMSITQNITRQDSINMFNESSLIIEQAGIYTFTIIANRESNYETFTYQLHAGWNMICATLEMTPESEDYMIEQGLMSMDTLSGNYTFVTHITLGKAYWFFSETERQLQIEGIPVDDFELDIQPGWNFVGPIKDTSLPIADYVVWEWSANGYRLPQVVDDEYQLQKGKGYWVYKPEE